MSFPQEGEKTVLGALVTHIRTSAMPSELPADARFVGLEDIASQEGLIISSPRVSDVRSRVFQFQAGDVLYSRLRPYLKKVVVADFDGYASGEIIVLRCSDRILPLYLQMLLLSEDFSHFIGARTKGDRPRTSFSTVASYELVLPSLETQDEVSVRDSGTAVAISRVKEAAAEFNSAAGSLMAATRSRLIWLANDRTPLVPLSKLVESIDYGTAQKSMAEGTGVPVLRIPNISSSGEIDARDLKYATLSREDLERFSVRSGDVLLIRSNGSLSLVGQAAKVGVDHENYAFAGYLLRMHPRNGVLSDYLLELVRSVPFRRMVETAAKSSTGINNLSARRLAAFSVPLPPIERQEYIVDVLAQLRNATSRSARHFSEASSTAAALREAARNCWLGQLPARPVATSHPAPEQTTPEEHSNARSLEMSDDIEAVILQCLEDKPSHSAHFEALALGVQVDYDSLRDAVFKMLAGNPPKLTQFFDRASGTIFLRRVK